MNGLTSSALCASLVLLSAGAHAQEVVRVAPVTTGEAAATESVAAAPAEAAPAEAAPATAGSETAAPASENAADKPAAEKGTEAKGAAAATVAAEPAPAPAAAPEPAPEPEVDPDSVPYTYHQNRWEVGIGGSAIWVPSESFDLFSGSDALPRFHVRAGRTFGIGSRFSFGIMPEWSYSGSGGPTRGIDTTIRMSEFGVGLEARYHMNHRFIGYLRANPGAVYTSGKLSDSITTMNAANYGFHVDAALGVSGRLAGSDDGRMSGPRLSWFVEGGFDWVASQDLSFEVDENAPLRTDPVLWNGLNMSAPHVGGGLIVSF